MQPVRFTTLEEWDVDQLADAAILGVDAGEGFGVGEMHPRASLAENLVESLQQCLAASAGPVVIV